MSRVPHVRFPPITQSAHGMAHTNVFAGYLPTTLQYKRGGPCARPICRNGIIDNRVHWGFSLEWRWRFWCLCLRCSFTCRRRGRRRGGSSTYRSPTTYLILSAAFGFEMCEIVCCWCNLTQHSNSTAVHMVTYEFVAHLERICTTTMLVGSAISESLCCVL